MTDMWGDLGWAALADLKSGDHVKVGYVASQGHLTAKTVAKNDNVAKK